MRSGSCGSLGVMSTCRGELPPGGSEACCKKRLRVEGFGVWGEGLGFAGRGFKGLGLRVYRAGVERFEVQNFRV